MLIQNILPFLLFKFCFILVWQIIELDKQRNTNREALRALKKEDMIGLNRESCMFAQCLYTLCNVLHSSWACIFAAVSHPVSGMECFFTLEQSKLNCC